MSDITSSETKKTELYFLVNRSALEILTEVQKHERSDDLVARAIVDGKLGDASIYKFRPQDTVEQNVLRLVTPDPDNALEVLARTPGVIFAGIPKRALELS